MRARGMNEPRQTVRGLRASRKWKSQYWACATEGDDGCVSGDGRCSVGRANVFHGPRVCARQLENGRRCVTVTTTTSRLAARIHGFMFPPWLAQSGLTLTQGTWALLAKHLLALPAFCS
ncbi:hypothetical protein M8818_004054 [Zalaria obscura]|uniref:Uncharacterized protein n=1 Tax=Zalaria obscura TaxID=2024903 RepID=A0ACC3SH40_9PEZI